MKKFIVLISIIFAFTSIGAETLLEKAKRKLEEMNQTKPKAEQSNSSSDSKKQDNSIDKNLIDFFLKNDKNEKFNIWGDIDDCRISNKKQQIIGDVWAIADNNQFSFSEFDKNSKHLITGKVLKLNLDSNDNKIIRISMEFRMMEWDNSIPNMLLNSDFEIINNYTVKTKYVEVLNLNGANKQIIIKDGIHLKNNLTQINYKCDAPETIASIREIDEQVEANKRSEEDLKRVEIAKKEQEFKKKEQELKNKENNEIKEAYTKGINFAKESGVTFKLFVNKDEMTGKESQYAMQTFKSAEGATADVIVKCTEKNWKIIFKINSLNVPTKLDFNNKREIATGRVNINGNIKEANFSLYQGDLKDFNFIGFTEIKDGALNELSYVDQKVKYLPIHTFMLELKTYKGNILAKIPPYDAAVNSIIRSCK